jgi:hypothetical protein
MFEGFAMKWIYRGIVLVLLTGSMLLNGLQYVGSALLDGVYNLAEGVTGITSASMIQKKETALAKQKRVIQGTKLKGLQSRVTKNLERVVGRGATRVGIEAIPIPGEMFLIPAFIAMEVGFVYYDIQDQCEFLDELNGWVTALDFEAQGKPEFCGYSPSELAKQLPSEVEFNEVIEQTSISQMMGDSGHQVYSTIEGWGQTYRDAVRIDQDSPMFVVDASISRLEEKAKEGWAVMMQAGSKASQYLKELWKGL